MTSATFFGPVDTKWKKTKLLELATSFGIDPPPSTVIALVAAIKKHMAEHPLLAEDPKYQGLFVYRPRNNQSQKQAKKSSDKVAEDLVESTKESGTVSGAYKFLMEGNYSTDPPAQHTRLDSLTKDHENSMQPSEKSGSESGSESKVRDDDSIPDEELSAPVPATPARKVSVANVKSHDAQLVVVTFQPKNSAETVPSEEVLVPVDEDLVSVTEVDGKRTFKASLSRLIPRAIENMSPKKAADTRILRPGVTAREGLIQLGSVGSFLSGKKPKSLNIELVDQYVLRSETDGILVCDLFLDEMKFDPKKIASMKDAGKSPIKPLEAARLRREVKDALKTPRKKSGFIDNNAEFIQFLRELLDVQPRPARAENVGLILERYLALEAGYKKLADMNWGRAKGGYRVPSNHESYPEQEFTKVHVQQAFEIQPTLASNDTALFEPSKLINCPDVLSWIEDPNGEHKSKFARMSTKNFREYISKQDEQVKLRHRDTQKKADRKERKRREREWDDEHISKKRRSSSFDSDGLDD